MKSDTRYEAVYGKIWTGPLDPWTIGLFFGLFFWTISWTKFWTIFLIFPKGWVPSLASFFLFFFFFWGGGGGWVGKWSHNTCTHAHSLLPVVMGGKYK